MGDPGNASNDAVLPRHIAIILSVLAAIAFYNVIELAFIIGFTFKTKRGLYFWAFVMSTIGIPLFTLGLFVKFMRVDAAAPARLGCIAVAATGWPLMVTGQSLVLYSRLHLIYRNVRALRWILWLIIVDTVICIVPTVVFAFGASTSNPGSFPQLYSIYERVEVTLFFVQENLLSTLYVWRTYKMLKVTAGIKSHAYRNTLRHLLWVNGAILLLDVSIVVMEYAGQYEIQTIYKCLVYSVKLKLEFRILNQLAEVTKGRATHHDLGYNMSGKGIDRPIKIDSNESRNIHTTDGHTNKGFETHDTLTKAYHPGTHHSQPNSNGIVVQVDLDQRVGKSSRSDSDAERMIEHDSCV